MLTLFDLIARVLDSRDAFGDAVNERRALRAAIWGYKEVAQRHKWSEYHTERVVLLNAPAEITASIDAAGLVTVTAGTIPTWIENATLLMNERPYVVERSVSGTTFTLEEYDAGVVTSQDLVLANDRIVIDDEIREIYSIKNELNRYDLSFVQPHEFRLAQQRYNASLGEPTIATSVRSSLRASRKMEIRLSPSPTTASTYRLSYYRNPRVATISHVCGKINATDATTTVTLSRPLSYSDITSVTQGDCVLYVATSSYEPDADIGYRVIEDNPIAQVLLVESVTDATTIELSEAISGGDIVDKGAVLTHVLDLPEGTEEAAAIFAEAKFLQVGEGSHGDFWQTVQIAERELRNKMELEGKLSRRGDSSSSRSATFIRAENITELP